MLVNSKIFLVLSSKPFAVLDNRIDLPKLVERYGIPRQRLARIVFRSRLVEEGRVNRFDVVLLETCRYYHVVGWRWTRTCAWFDNLPQCLEIEHNSATTSDVIRTAIIGKEIEAITFAQIYVVIPVKAAEILAEMRCAVDDGWRKKITMSYHISPPHKQLGYVPTWESCMNFIQEWT